MIWLFVPFLPFKVKFYDPFNFNLLLDFIDFCYDLCITTGNPIHVFYKLLSLPFFIFFYHYSLCAAEHSFLPQQNPFPCDCLFFTFPLCKNTKLFRNKRSKFFRYKSIDKDVIHISIKILKGYKNRPLQNS